MAIYCFQLSYIIRPDRIVIQPRNKRRIIDFSIGKPIEWAGLLYILI